MPLPHGSWFILPCDATLVIYAVFVCQFVRLSQAGNVPTTFDERSRKQHRTIAQGLVFHGAPKISTKFHWDHP